MAQVQRTKLVKAGDWRTLESGWNASFSCSFFLPVGAEVKVRKGTGWPLGWDSQKQRLDGIRPRVLNVSGPIPSRVQMRTSQDVNVTYTYITVGP